MKELVEKIEELKEDPEVSSVVDSRIRAFEEKGREGNEEWFLELCFCLMTANSSAKKVLEIFETIGKEPFLSCSKEDLSKLFKDNGYRFYNKRAEYIIEARRYASNIKDIVTSFDDGFDAREWLVREIKGLGYKEASHFLRNVSYRDLAILDRHILRTLHENGLTGEVPESLSKKKYIEFEEKTCKLNEACGMSLARLDLYLWYLKTGKILK
ncbi:MAG: N-glycosylase/DNA lyase [Halobacteriota archaeon]|nr:N-glycosylase/DNA lyase [Halobacteriota archaeon]